MGDLRRTECSPKRNDVSVTVISQNSTKLDRKLNKVGSSYTACCFHMNYVQNVVASVTVN